ncbi:MAG: cupin domain-containing protein [Candidatus Competibacterales bacterium]|nr:cupin domain-containing protein [Candidatus Competibacterales bacterium]
MSRRAAPFTPPPNLLRELPDARAAEVFETLLQRPGCRIERIVSHGQATPADEWWVQDWDEWVVVLAGHAGLSLEGQDNLPLAVGDHVLIPAGTRHRVAWTHPEQPTVWLAVHLGAPDQSSDSSRA